MQKEYLLWILNRNTWNLLSEFTLFVLKITIDVIIIHKGLLL